ncbi:hypothetical protein VC116063_003420 [Vibrio cholerae O1 str. 116063]|nr:hypothetical protein VCHC43B1_1706 [Vibrio cholerae HC-43B1]EMP90318.1 hypothetical protein VC116063_003420 [Vibrio cholerae O1 str. 116063]
MNIGNQRDWTDTSDDPLSPDLFLNKHSNQQGRRFTSSGNNLVG